MKESILQELAVKIRVRPYLFFITGRVNYYDEIEPRTFDNPGYFDRIIIFADLHNCKF